jgi:transposase
MPDPRSRGWNVEIADAHIAWVLAFTIAAEIGEIERFQSPQNLTGYTGLCPRVNQSETRTAAAHAFSKRGVRSTRRRCSSDGLTAL